jgi:hypothetical protein
MLQVKGLRRLGRGHYEYRGYSIVRGGYVGTTDDRADTWYVHRIGAGLSVRHAGYCSVREACDAIDATEASLA